MDYDSAYKEAQKRAEKAAMPVNLMPDGKYELVVDKVAMLRSDKLQCDFAIEVRGRVNKGDYEGQSFRQTWFFRQKAGGEKQLNWNLEDLARFMNACGFPDIMPSQLKDEIFCNPFIDIVLMATKETRVFQGKKYPTWKYWSLVSKPEVEVAGIDLDQNPFTGESEPIE